MGLSVQHSTSTSHGTIIRTLDGPFLPQALFFGPSVAFSTFQLGIAVALHISRTIEETAVAL
ncbi:hypothetical protein EJ04DRAFT_516180 [Polyplosphaeria fusca]|uniref:Uncharacterized protein n=1 Tax=Polyplosphaeria fusca TaxID=682080 RepID=A0A9P4QQC0_9PLEO|nr:hypothetical protein EJ04DRAFT_516180 [Polyplosphaeria fusca]